jgi:hypothetical protein
MSARQSPVFIVVIAWIAFTCGIIVAIAVPAIVSRSTPPAPRPDNMLALVYGPGKYGTTLYGACLFTVQTPFGVDIRAHVWIDSPDSFHDCGVIATTPDLQQARAAFNTVTFDAVGIHAGNATTSQLIAAAGTYDNHR